MIALLFLTLIFFMLIGVPIAGAIGLSSMIYILIKGIPLVVIAQRLFTGTDSIILVAIPAFIVAGAVMEVGGLAKRLVGFSEVLVGRITGGLSAVTILSAAFFAAISGSNVATTAAVGGIMVPEMSKRGYDKAYAAAVAAAGGVMGVIIPPSLSMVIYGAIANTSIGSLFLAGIPVGILMCVTLLVISYYIGKKRGYEGDTTPVTASRFFKAFKDAVWALGTPLILIGGILGGVFTPTEAAVFSVVYGVIVSIFIYRELTFKQLPALLLKATINSAVIMFIIANASLFGWLMAAEQVPQQVLNLLMGISDNPIIILLIINLALLLAGCFMETAALLLIVTPVLLPVITLLGISPVQFGLMMILNLSIGNLTPPLGVCLYTGAMISGTKVEQVTKNVLPYLIGLLIILGLVTYVPEITMALPKILGAK